MASIYTHRSQSIARTWALMAGFFVLVMLAGWGAAYAFQNPTLLWGAVFMSLAMNIGAYWFSDKVAIMSSGAKPADGTEWLELHRMVENLSIAAGLPKPKVYIIQDSAPNAFATGRNPQHAAVAVTTGLLERLEKVEVEGVLAHELAHIGNRDILVMTIAVVLVGFLSIIADMAMRMSFFGGNREEGKAGVLILIATIVGMIVIPIAGQLMQLAVSRRREFLADATGALITRYPEGLASALEKISGYPAPMQHANHATAHLYISNPFGGEGGVGGFVARMFATHPPALARIAALRAMNI